MTLGKPPLNGIDASYAEAFDEPGIAISPDLRRKASAATQGSPYLFQLMGHNIVLYANESSEVTEQKLVDALLASRADFKNDVCSTTLAMLSTQDVRFLAAMAEDAKTSKMSDIAERLNVTQDYTQKYRKRLLDAGVIEVAGRGLVRFAVPYLANKLRAGAL